jgi:hypothetical protein
LTNRLLRIMKVAGFTFIKDAIIYDCPIVEVIQSILPLCDEMIVAVGQSNDKTLQLIRTIHIKQNSYYRNNLG